MDSVYDVFAKKIFVDRLLIKRNVEYMCNYIY